MKRGIALFILIAVVTCMCILLEKPTLHGADAYYIEHAGTPRDSTWHLKSDRSWREYRVDTLTIYADGDTTISLGHWGYNFRIRSLNGAGDSGFAVISFGAKGIFHDDSVARNLLADSVGFESADDWLLAPMEANTIYIRPIVGGTADSNVTLQFEYFR